MRCVCFISLQNKCSETFTACSQLGDKLHVKFFCFYCWTVIVFVVRSEKAGNVSVHEQHAAGLKYFVPSELRSAADSDQQPAGCQRGRPHRQHPHPRQRDGHYLHVRGEKHSLQPHWQRCETVMLHANKTKPRRISAGGSNVEIFHWLSEIRRWPAESAWWRFHGNLSWVEYLRYCLNYIEIICSE